MSAIFSWHFGRWIGRSRFNEEVVGLRAHTGGVDALHPVPLANARRHVDVSVGGAVLPVGLLRETDYYGDSGPLSCRRPGIMSA